MEIEILEREALSLTPDQRALLALELLDSLEALPPQELDRLWLDAAGQRAAQLDAGEVQFGSAENVDRGAGPLLG